MVGSPDTIAARMGEIMEDVGGDGFLLYPEMTRHTISLIADGVGPALQRRGLIRDGFSKSTFRENSTRVLVVLTATNDDVLTISATDAVAVMWDAVRAHGNGELSAPARTTIEIDSSAVMTLTSGRLPGVAAGFRVYSSAAEATEMTVVFQPSDEPVGIVLGPNLGRRRTGALGGVAASICARPTATTIGLIGAGAQAFTQLWAIAAVRELSSARVYSHVMTATSFAERAKAELGLIVEVVSSPRVAVSAADIVVLSTPSPQPLIEVDWLRPALMCTPLAPRGRLKANARKRWSAGPRCSCRTRRFSSSRWRVRINLGRAGGPRCRSARRADGASQ